MKKIAFVFLISALAFGGCDLFKSKKQDKKPAVNKRAKADLREENNDVDFQAFVGRLKKAVAAHDVNTLAGMMTEDFAYVLGKTPGEDRKGDGVFKYWDENNLWPELEGILTEALAQAAGIAAASGYAETERPLFLLSAIRTMKFFGVVRPEQQIELRAEKMAASDTLFQFKVTASVEGAIVAEGQLVLSLAAPPGRAA